MSPSSRSRPPGAPARSRLRPPRSPAQLAAPVAAAPPGGELEPGLRELRSSIGNLRAAAEALAYAAVPRPARSARASRPAALLQAVVEEAERASRAVDLLAVLLHQSGGAAPPASVTTAANLAAELARQAAADLDLSVSIAATIDESLVLPLSFAPSILGALARLRLDYGVSEVELGARRHADLLALEISFVAREPEASRLRDEHNRVLAGGARGEPALGAAARAAGGEAWLAIRRGEATFSLRLLLPLAPLPAPLAGRDQAPGNRSPRGP